MSRPIDRPPSQPASPGAGRPPSHPGTCTHTHSTTPPQPRGGPSTVPTSGVGKPGRGGQGGHAAGPRPHGEEAAESGLTPGVWASHTPGKDGAGGAETMTTILTPLRPGAATTLTSTNQPEEQQGQRGRRAPHGLSLARALTRGNWGLVGGSHCPRPCRCPVKPGRDPQGPAAPSALLGALVPTFWGSQGR